jgi:hypothetical protein
MSGPSVALREGERLGEMRAPMEILGRDDLAMDRAIAVDVEFRRRVLACVARRGLPGSSRANALSRERDAADASDPTQLSRKMSPSTVANSPDSP